MKTYKIHLIRHGLTEGNIKGQYVGSTDLPICDEGEIEILSLKNDYRYPFVDKIYTSPLLRCKQTAEIIYDTTSFEVIDELTEYCFGDFEGRSFEDLKDDEEFLKWFHNSIENAPPNGENMAEFSARCYNAFDKIVIDLLKSENTDVAIIAHGGVIMSILSQYVIGDREYTDWLVGNGKGYTVSVTPQLYMTGKIVEVYGTLPIGIENMDTARLKNLYFKSSNNEQY